MSNKGFAALILAIILGFAGFEIVSQVKKPPEVKLGVKHAEQGRDHISSGQKHPAYNSDPPSSGPHYSDANAPAPWGAYSQQVPEEVFIHNEEHGGVVITYNPKLLNPPQLKRLQNLFTVPYSSKDFSPTKALITPRIKNKHMIEIAAWTYTLNLDRYDEASLMKFYLQHVNKSPEPTAGPNDPPVIQGQ